MHLERCIADMWYWWWLLILLNFAVILCFWLSIADKMKEGKLIHDWLVVLPTVSFCECLFAIIYDGDGSFSGKVASVNLLTDRNYKRIQVSSNIGVSLFVTYGVGGIFEWVVSFIPEKSWTTDIDKEPVKPMHLSGGAKCYWLTWDNDWSGAWDNRPVNPMHLCT